MLRVQCFFLSSFSQWLWSISHITTNICTTVGVFLKTISTKCKTLLITCKGMSHAQNGGHSSKASIHINESVCVIKKSPDTIIYEQDSQMAGFAMFSLGHFNSVFQCKKSQIFVTIPENAPDSTKHSHLKTTVKVTHLHKLYL